MSKCLNCKTPGCPRCGTTHAMWECDYQEKIKMRKYCVTYHETYEENYEIEANSPKEAVEILLERIREGKEDGPENCSDSWADVTEL